MPQVFQILDPMQAGDIDPGDTVFPGKITGLKRLRNSFGVFFVVIRDNVDFDFFIDFIAHIHQGTGGMSDSLGPFLGRFIHGGIPEDPDNKPDHAVGGGLRKDNSESAGSRQGNSLTNLAELQDIGF